VEAAAENHGHTIADVAGLQSALDGKAAATHTHALADLSSLDANGGAFTNYRASQDTVGGAYTFVATDSGREKVFIGGLAATWIVPALAGGTQATVHNVGSADVTFLPLGVTIQGATALPAGTTGFLSWLPDDVVKIRVEVAPAESPVSPDANNQLTAAPKFWAGTQTNYDALTPAAGTVYFVVEA
jgi:hypothetical protein